MPVGNSPCQNQGLLQLLHVTRGYWLPRRLSSYHIHLGSVTLKAMIANRYCAAVTVPVCDIILEIGVIT